MGEMNDGNVSEMGLLEFCEYCQNVNVSEMICTSLPFFVKDIM